MADWLPTREREGAKITACGWNQAECTAVLNKVNAFLLARNAYTDDDSTAKLALGIHPAGSEQRPGPPVPQRGGRAEPREVRSEAPLGVRGGRLCQNSENRDDAAIYSGVRPHKKANNTIYTKGNGF